MTDGSGSNWDYPMGWAAVLIDRGLQKRKLIFGANNLGTNQLAEFMPFALAMGWYASGRGPGAAHLKQLRTLGDPRDLIIHCISDSEITVKQGNGEYGTENNDWWSVLNRISGRGYYLKFHWVARESIGLNRLCDDASRRIRTLLQSTDNLLKSVLTMCPEIVDDFAKDIPNINDDNWVRSKATGISRKTK